MRLLYMTCVKWLTTPSIASVFLPGRILVSFVYSTCMVHLLFVLLQVTNIPAPLPAVGSQRSTTPALGKMWAQTAHTRLLLGHSSCMLSVERCLNHQERDRTVDLVKSRTVGAVTSHTTNYTHACMHCIHSQLLPCMHMHTWMSTHAWHGSHK